MLILEGTIDPEQNSIASYTHFSILAILLVSTVVHGADHSRQKQIDKLLANYKKRKEADSQQRLLRDDGDEAEQKHDTIEHITTFARAGVLQCARNKNYTARLREILQQTPFPKPHQEIVLDYTRPEPVLHTTFKHHNGRIYNFHIQDRSQPCSSYSKSKTDYERTDWNSYTGTLLGTIHNVVLYKKQPEELRTASLMNTMYEPADFAYSPDKTKIVAATFSGDLFISRKGQSLLQVITQKNAIHFADDQTTTNPFMSVTFSPCSQYIFAGRADGTVTQLHLTSLESVYTFGHDAAVTALKTAKDDDTLYAGLEDGRVCVWKNTAVLPTVYESADTPPTAVMAESNILERLTSAEDLQIRHAQDFLCIEDTGQCCEHGKKCCSLCAEQRRLIAACCRTGALCALHCPRTCTKCCYLSCVKNPRTCICCCLGCTQKICCSPCGRILRAIRRVWQ